MVESSLGRETKEKAGQAAGGFVGEVGKFFSTFGAGLFDLGGVVVDTAAKTDDLGRAAGERITSLFGQTLGPDNLFGSSQGAGFPEPTQQTARIPGSILRMDGSQRMTLKLPSGDSIVMSVDEAIATWPHLARAKGGGAITYGDFPVFRNLAEAALRADAQRGAFQAQTKQRKIDTENKIPRTGGGGGGGGGAIGPVYVKPDQRAVREQVKNYVVATLGKLNDGLINDATQKYMAAHKGAFNKRETEAVDPWQDVQAVVRGDAGYKAIHGLRPEGVDEMEWVTSDQGLLRQLGLSAKASEQVGINTATSGASDQAVQTAGQVAQQGSTGRLLEVQRDSLARSASAVARLI